MYCAYDERAHDKILTSNELGMNIACGGYMITLINVFVTTGNMRCYLLNNQLPQAALP